VSGQLCRQGREISSGIGPTVAQGLGVKMNAGSLTELLKPCSNLLVIASDKEWAIYDLSNGEKDDTPIASCRYGWTRIQISDYPQGRWERP